MSRSILVVCSHMRWLVCVRVQLPARLDGENEEEDEPPGPMTTRLRRQAEREREQEQEQKEQRRESFDSDNLPAVTPTPSQWTVEQVCAYINSIPGKVARKMRKQNSIYAYFSNSLLLFWSFYFSS